MCLVCQDLGLLLLFSVWYNLDREKFQSGWILFTFLFHCVLPLPLYILYFPGLLLTLLCSHLFLYLSSFSTSPPLPLPLPVLYLSSSSSTSPLFLYLSSFSTSPPPPSPTILPSLPSRIASSLPLLFSTPSPLLLNPLNEAGDGGACV